MVGGEKAPFAFSATINREGLRGWGEAENALTYGF